MCGVLTGRLQRSAPETCSVYAVDSLGRTRLFLVMPHNPSPANPQALSFLYLWVLARDLQHQFLLCFVCNYIRVALMITLGSQWFPSSVFQEKSASGLCCWDHKQEWEWVDPELGGQVASKEGNVSFHVLMVNTWAFEHICLQIALAVIKDTFSWKCFLKVQRNKGGQCVKEHLVGLISY